MYKYFIKLLLVLAIGLFSHSAWAKTPMRKYLPTGLQIGVDISSPIYYKLYKKTGIKYEVNGLVNFSRLLVQIDYGWGYMYRQARSIQLRDSKNQAIQSFGYNLGQYFRIGLDYNFLQNSVDDNAAFAGIRYAKSYCYDQLKSVLLDEYYQLLMRRKPNASLHTPTIWNDHFIDSEQYNMLAQWLELVVGFRVKLWQWIYLGGTARYQFNKKLSNAKGHIPFDIVGWGINSTNAVSLNAHLILRIPLQKRSLSD
jgi:hypothetical protein